MQLFATILANSSFIRQTFLSDSLIFGVLRPDVPKISPKKVINDILLHCSCLGDIIFSVDLLNRLIHLSFQQKFMWHPRKVRSDPTLPVLLGDLNTGIRLKVGVKAEMITHSSKCGQVQETAAIEKRCLMFTLQMALLSMIWLSSWLHIPPKTAMVTVDQRCLETVCQIPVWRGREGRGGEDEEAGEEGREAPKDLLGSPRRSETKGTLWHWLTHPRKHYFLSHQLQHILRTWAAHFPELKVPFFF